MSKFESKWLSWAPFRRTSVSFVSSADECLKKSKDLANRSKYSDIDKDNLLKFNNLKENPSSSSCEETNHHPFLGADKTDKSYFPTLTTTVKPLTPMCPRNKVPWPEACLESQRRFGERHARLFPLIKKKVQTPVGSGILFSVLSSPNDVIAGVVLDGASDRVTFIKVDKITPTQNMH